MKISKSDWVHLRFYIPLDKTCHFRANTTNSSVFIFFITDSGDNKF